MTVKISQIQICFMDLELRTHKNSLGQLFKGYLARHEKGRKKMPYLKIVESIGIEKGRQGTCRGECNMHIPRLFLRGSNFPLTKDPAWMVSRFLKGIFRLN